jgi:hypothetical protein
MEGKKGRVRRKKIVCFKSFVGSYNLLECKFVEQFLGRV